MIRRFFMFSAFALVGISGTVRAATVPITYDYQGTSFYDGNDSFVAESNTNETRLNNGTLGTSQAGGSDESIIYKAGMFELYYGVGMNVTVPSDAVLNTLDVSYGVVHGPGVHAPTSLTISDGVHDPIVYTSFDDSDNVNAGGDARLASIPLTGLTGPNLSLTFGTNSFAALSQLTVTSPVPEPTTLGIVGAGAFLLSLRRSRRSIAD